MNIYTKNRQRPATYKYMVIVPKEVYVFMLSGEGVGSADTMFETGNDGFKTKFYHNPDGCDMINQFAFYRQKREAKNFIAWLADWYYSAKTGEPMMLSLINK